MTDNDAKEAFGFNLKRIRKDKGLTQVEVQGLTGITQSALSMLEAGISWPDHKTVQQLALALRCKETDLFKPVK